MTHISSLFVQPRIMASQSHVKVGRDPVLANSLCVSELMLKMNMYTARAREVACKNLCALL